MDAVSLQPISAEQLAVELRGHDVLLVDVRPPTQYCTCRIKQAENINFSCLHLRRILKGVVKMEALIPSQLELCKRITQRERSGQKLVLYDASSTKDNMRTDMKKYAEVFSKTELGTPTTYYINGGYEAFSAEFPELCCSGDECSSESPPTSLRISVSASLPTSLGSSRRTNGMSLLTPIEGSEDAKFGPPVQVLPYLALGCAKDAADVTQLRSMGVTAILNVSHNCPNFFETLFEYKTIPVKDSYQADLLSKLQAAFDFINSVKEKGGCVLVHCNAGVSRSATVCIAYVMKHLELDLSKSYDFVKQKRPCISPNLHFMGQLLEFEKLVNAANSESTVSEPVEEMDSCTTTPAPPDSNDTSLPSVTTAHSTTTTVVDIVGSAADMDTTIDTEGVTCNVESPQSASAPSFLNLYSSPKRKRSSSYNPAAVQYSIYYSSTDGALYRLTREHVQQTSSVSLPTTPVASLSNHLPSVNNLSFKSRINMSPCRVVAACRGGNICKSLTSVQIPLD